jgi:hypothetical protein
MRRLVVCLLAAALAGAAAGAATAAPARSQTLTAPEERWAKPMITIWNAMNAGLHLFYTQATAKDALVPGSANNLPLTKTLAAFVECTPAVKKAGAPPTPRLQSFATALAQACVHLGNGAQNLAKGLGAFGKGKNALGKTLVGNVGPELKLATSLLGTAERRLISVGGKKVFTA